MGTRHFALIPLAVMVLAACGEQQRETVTGPDFKVTPPAGSCDFVALPGLVRNYFPGPRQNAIVTLVGSMQTAGERTAGARSFGFAIMDSIGFLSRDVSVATIPANGAALTIGLINCMFDASGFTYPTNPTSDFTNALTRNSGGAYYTRGVGAGSDSVVMGTDFSVPDDPSNLSGISPSTGTWANMLDQNSASEGRALFFGYVTVPDPLEYEWATIPPNTTFDPAAAVAVCDGTGGSANAMVNESNIGVLAYTSANAICSASVTQPLAMIQGWGPRALTARLARAIVTAVTPAPLHATLLTKSGTGGTATTFKSKVKTRPVEQITFTFTSAPKTIFISNPQQETLVVRATVDNGTVGVNGVCVYVTGSNNNGQNTALQGTRDPDCANTPLTGLSAKTQSIIDGSGKLSAGYATMLFDPTKTGGLILTASSTDASDVTGVLGRTGQTFVNGTFKTNVKP
jgi:hypothetical protein